MIKVQVDSIVWKSLISEPYSEQTIELNKNTQNCDLLECRAVSKNKNVTNM